MAIPHTVRRTLLGCVCAALASITSAATVAFSGGYTGELLCGVAPGSHTIAAGLLELDLDSAHGDLASTHTSVLFPHGGSLTESWAGDLFTVSNIDAPSGVRLFELWLEQELWHETASLRLGQLAADAEFAATDTGSLFINGTAGWPAILGVNVPAAAYPAAVPGVRFAIQPGSAWTWRTGIFSGTPDPLDSDGRDRNRHGMHFGWEETFAISELERAVEFRALPGVAKLGLWHHSGRFDSFARAAETAVGEETDAATVRGNWGGYVSLDQRLTREASGADTEGLSAVARAGWAGADRNFLTRYCEAGFAYTGLLPRRAQDSCGIFVAYGRVGSAARNFFAADAEPAARPDYEMVVEAAYRAALGYGVTLQAIASTAIHPGALPGRSFTTLGLRAVASF